MLPEVRAVSLRLGQDGFPRAAYVHDTLCYARYDGAAWYTETVDAVPGGHQVPAPSASLALDGTGKAHIGYVAGGQLRYAGWTGAGWVTDTVAVAGEWVSLAVDGAGIPHLSYTAPQGMIYARREGSTWVTTTVTDTASAQTSLVLARPGSRTSLSRPMPPLAMPIGTGITGSRRWLTASRAMTVM